MLGVSATAVIPAQPIASQDLNQSKLFSRCCNAQSSYRQMLQLSATQLSSSHPSEGLPKKVK